MSQERHCHRLQTGEEHLLSRWTAVTPGRSHPARSEFLQQSEADSGEMTLSDLSDLSEDNSRLIVPFWNWSSISLAATDQDRHSVLLNQTGPGHGLGHSDVDCSGFINVP